MRKSTHQMIIFLLVCCSGVFCCKANTIASYTNDTASNLTFNGENHCAFTALTKVDNKYYCMYREASGHQATDGVLKILRSDDAINWNLWAVIDQQPYINHYERKFATLGSSLYVIGQSVILSSGQHHSVISQVPTIGNPPFYLTSQEITLDWQAQTGLQILWSVIRNNTPGGSPSFFGLIYRGSRVSLFSSNDLYNWDLRIDNLLNGNESDAVIRDNKLYVVSRTDYDPKTIFGTVVDLNNYNILDSFAFCSGANSIRIGSPHIFSCLGKDYVALRRFYTSNATAVTLGQIDWQTKSYIPLFDFPNGYDQDNAYCGVIQDGAAGEYLISYYSGYGHPNPDGAYVWTARFNVTPSLDSFTRANNTDLGQTEKGDYSYQERRSDTGGSVNCAAIDNNSLTIFGYQGGGTPGEVVLDSADLKNACILSAIRFDSQNPTASSCNNGGGIILRKSTPSACFQNAEGIGQINVAVTASGGVLVRQQTGINAFHIFYSGNPFTGSNSLNSYQEAGSLPLKIGDLSFDTDGDGKLESDEPFQLEVRLIDQVLQVKINEKSIWSGTVYKYEYANNYMAIEKVRVATSGHNITSVYFDDLNVQRYSPPADTYQFAIGDNYDRPDSTDIGVTSCGSRSYQERNGVGDSSANVAAITNNRLCINGDVNGSSPGQVVINDGSLANLKMSAMIRFSINNPTGIKSNNSLVFNLRKPHIESSVNDSSGEGQIWVHLFPTGGIIILQQTKDNGKIYLYNRNLIGNYDDVAYHGPGSLPLTYNGQGFDLDQDGWLENNEPVKLGVELVDQDIKVLINDYVVWAGKVHSPVNRLNYVSLAKQRWCFDGITVDTMMFDDLEIKKEQ